jgi:hypothetical protein
MCVLTSLLNPSNVCADSRSAHVSAAKGLPLDWRPILRDAVFNVVSLVYLVAVCADGRVYWCVGVRMHQLQQIWGMH